MTTLTPVEQARQADRAAQQRIQELGQTLNQLSNDRAAALAAGDVEEANKINSRIGQVGVEYRIAGGAGGGQLAEAQVAVSTAERAIREARNRVADLSNVHDRLSRESVQAIERAHLLTSGLQQVQQQLAAARKLLTQLVPPEQPAAAPESAPAPVERGAEPERPYRVVGGFGSQARYYNRDGEETDAQNRPLVLLGETITDSADD